MRLLGTARLAAAITFAIATALSCAGLGCSRHGDAPPAPGSAAVPLAASAPAKGSSPGAPLAVLDFLAPDAPCTFGHRGFLLDLGDSTMRARMSGAKLAVPDVEPREHEGATWAGVHARSLELSFVSPVEMRGDAGVVVEARVRGGAAKSAFVYVGGKAVGSLQLTKGETTVVSIHSASASIARGANDVLLRFVGGGKATHDMLAEIDWIRVGPWDGDAPYSAPTRGDAITTVAIGGLARRGVSLRAPGFARCAGFVPNGALLEGFVGVTNGEADAEVQVLVDRAEPRVAGSFHLGGEGAPAWRPISLPLGDVGTIAGVELVAKSSAKGARVVFAEPRVVVPAAADTTIPKASRGVILVVMGTAPTKMLSPWGGPIAMPELTNLATNGITYDTHRASTSWASGALASMLTGLPARDHGVAEPDAALGASVVTIAEAARQGGVVTAMFTANPTTSAAYGFKRGWETFVSEPVAVDDATSIFDDVSKWLDGHKDDRFLVVVHARGGHPPWDATAEELKAMPPPGYQGSLDAKHAGEMLGKAKKTHSMTDPDRQRAFALHAKALGAHDAGLGRLVAHVRALGRDADTTWIVTGDVGADAAAHVPFIEDDALDEATLAVPLVVRGPSSAKPPRPHVTTLTSSLDVARTALDALGLPPPPQMRGEDLWLAAEHDTPVERGATLATTLDRFSVRWGGFVLTGARDREAKLCNLSLEPDCVADVRATHPIAAEVLHALVYDDLAAKKAVPAPRATPDAATLPSLREWGR